MFPFCWIRKFISLDVFPLVIFMQIYVPRILSLYLWKYLKYCWMLVWRISFQYYFSTYIWIFYISFYVTCTLEFPTENIYKNWRYINAISEYHWNNFIINKIIALLTRGSKCCNKISAFLTLPTKLKHKISIRNIKVKKKKK